MSYNHLHIASLNKRVLNAIIDMIVILFLWILIFALLMILGFDDVYIAENGDQLPVIALILPAPIFWGYYIISEYFFQRTVGKLITGTKVISNSGIKPSFRKVLGRTMCRSIPFEYLSYLINVNGLHDRLSGTVVIKIY